MKKASAKIKRKIKNKFVRAISRMEAAEMARARMAQKRRAQKAASAKN